MSQYVWTIVLTSVNCFISRITYFICCLWLKITALFKSTIQPTSSLHNLLLPRREHPSITRFERSPQNFLASPPEPNYQSFFSHMLSPTIRLHNCFSHCIYCFFVFAFYNCSASGSLAITFNKRYKNLYPKKLIPNYH